jgi:hypothetical protein
MKVRAVPVIWVTAILIVLGAVDGSCFNGRRTVNVVAQAQELDATLDRHVDRLMHHTVARMVTDWADNLVRVVRRWLPAQDSGVKNGQRLNE